MDRLVISTPRQAAELAFGCYSTKELVEDTIKWVQQGEAQRIWEAYQEEEPKRTTLLRRYNKEFTYIIPKVSVLKKHTDIVKETTQEYCKDCKGSGLIQSPYWESIRVTIPCPTCAKEEQ